MSLACSAEYVQLHSAHFPSSSFQRKPFISTECLQSYLGVKLCYVLSVNLLCLHLNPLIIRYKNVIKILPYKFNSLTHSLTHTSYSNYRLLLAKIKLDSTTGTNLYGSSLTCGGSFGVLTAQGSGASSASTTLVG